MRVFTATMPPNQKPLHTRPSPNVLTSWLLFLAAGCLLYSALVSSSHVAGDDTQLLSLQPPPPLVLLWRSGS